MENEIIELKRRISDKAMRRINTLADKKILTVKDLNDSQKGLMFVVLGNTEGAYNYAKYQSEVDWEDKNYKRNFKKIAKFIGDQNSFPSQ